MEIEPDRAVILARVSTAKQADEGTSLETQGDHCVALAASLGAVVHKIYREDGESGALYHARSELQDALRDIEENRAKLFITFQIDRSGRETQHLLQIRKRVLDAGGRFMLANGMEFPNTPEGDLIFTQMAGYAQYEKAIIRQRTVNGRNRRAKEGKQPCRRYSPMGCQIVRKSDVIKGLYPESMLGQYVWLESSRWPKEMFFKFASGVSMRTVGRWLKANGILTKEGLEIWSASSIRRVLMNPVYKGEPAYGKTKRCVDDRRKGKIGAHGKLLTRVDYIVPRPESEWTKLACEPLVPVEIWDECQRRLRENKRRRGGNPKRRFLLGGMVTCPICGKIMGGTTQKKKFRYYTCPYDRGCKWRANAELVEDFVTRGIISVAEDSSLADVALNVHKHSRDVDTILVEIKRLQVELDGLQRKERALVDAELEARLELRDAVPYKTRLIGLAETRAGIEVKLEQLKRAGAKEAELPTAEAIAKVLAAVKEALLSPHLTAVEKNEILSTVVSEVRINEASTEIVLALRSLIVGLMAETYSQILTRGIWC